MKNTVDNAPKINDILVGKGITPPPFSDVDTFPSPSFLPDEKWGKKVYSLLRHAKQEILIATFKFEICHKPRGRPLMSLISELISARNKNVSVKILLNIGSEYRSTSPGNLYASKWLSQFGIETKHLARGRTCHLKLLLVDRKSLILGSHNWSVRSMSSNAEASLFIEDRKINLEIFQYFQHLWSIS